MVAFYSYITTGNITGKATMTVSNTLATTPTPTTPPYTPPSTWAINSCNGYNYVQYNIDDSFSH
jgi:hypothetical protein